MPRRTPRARLAAVLLASLLALSGPGAALSHGVAHARERDATEHRDDDRHGLHLVERLLALVHGHAHDEASARAHAPTDASHDAPGLPTRSHEHPRLDAPAVPRLVVDAFLPALPVLAPVAPAIVATVQAPPPASPLRLAKPPTGPPPPSRAPPLG